MDTLHRRDTVLLLGLTALLHVSLSHADSNDVTRSIENALKFGQDDAKYGQIKLDLKFRYENFDSNAANKQVANAATARLRLGYLSPVYDDFQGYVEYEGNQDIVANTYNSTRNGKTQYETIPDPQEHELNQLWLSYKGIADTEIKVGRQKLELDNQRFISPTPWRQMERTFDGLLITNKSLPNTTVILGYLLKQQNVDSTMQGMQLPLANISYNFAGWGSLTGYLYLYDNNERHQDSNETYGVRFNGSRELSEDLTLHYTAEYARQVSYVQSPVVYHADYYHFAAGATAFGVTLKGAMEQLDGKGLNQTFDTPLALLHNFNGWADMFLVTPNAGLRDIYVSLDTAIEGVKLSAQFHDFSDDSGKIHYGKEWGVWLTKEFLKHYSLMAKYAYFDSDMGETVLGMPPFPDTQKFWLGAGISF